MAHRLDTTQPFTTADARAAGITEHQLRGRSHRRLFHGIYVASSVVVTMPLRASAALMVGGEGAHVSHFTAARLWNLWVPDDADVHITVPPGAIRTKRRGIRAHLPATATDVVVRDGLATSSPVQCFLDLAACLDLVELIVLGDSIVARGHASPADLVAAAALMQGKGSRQARRAAELVRAGVDSPMETRLRMLVVLAGLPEPVVNHVLYTEDGRWKVRFDLSYPQWRIAIEYDGRQHAEDDRQWQRDIDRREELDRLGWRLVIIRAPGIYADPAGTLARIVEVLRARGAVGVRVRGDEWRRHFPGRAAA